jgi:methylsterol monooxygenase
MVESLNEAWSGDTVLLYGVGTYCVLLGSWAASSAPFVALNHFGIAERYRMQPASGGGSPVSSEIYKIALRMVSTNWILVFVAVTLGAPVIKWLFPADAPTAVACTLTRSLGVIVLWFFLHDFSFYWYHRVLHEVPSLYRRFHKPHHIFTAPFGWMSHATHPVELTLQSVGGMAGPLIWSFAYGLNLKTWWAWLALIQVQGVMDHCGYEFPWPLDLFGCLPGLGGTAFHDDHHRLFTCNYAAVFSVIDHIFGTSRRCKEAAKAKKQEKTS